MAKYMAVKRLDVGWPVLPGEIIEDPESPDILIGRGYIVPVHDDDPREVARKPEPAQGAQAKMSDVPLDPMTNIPPATETVADKGDGGHGAIDETGTRPLIDPMTNIPPGSGTETVEDHSGSGAIDETGKKAVVDPMTNIPPAPETVLDHSDQPNPKPDQVPAESPSQSEPGHNDLASKSPEALANAHTRDELNDIASKAGVADPESHPNKAAVAEAIVATAKS